ncbi:LysR family transcriptional regulator [Pseudonocardia sp. TRM90224]|uniref:LysR family transcriptional regulator n=1 Tax=Pseudonocardia sp. TRM90224 TaxID=2812678 RepID=UPI001E34FB7A|nr:LysR family transcriptional regulator [Pseudonocardia sp. TRM90224]
MLNVPRLRALYEVSRHGSFTGAAEVLRLTTSAVSQQIALLEREAGAQLVERHARGVRLTEPGRVLARHAENLLAELRAADDALAAVGSGEGGRLRFGSFTTANAALMPKAVAAFRSAFPQVELTLLEADSDEGLAQVAEHHLDLALVYEFPLVPMIVPAGVTTSPLLQDALSIVVPAGHPLAGRARVRLAELAGEIWVQGVRSGSTAEVLPQACLRAGFEPRVAFRTDDQMTVRGLVAAGVGIALTPWLAMAATPPDLVVVRLDEPTLTRTVFAATSSGPYRLPAADAMIDHLRNAATEMQDSPRPR